MSTSTSGQGLSSPSKTLNGNGSPTHKGRRMDASPTRNGLVRQEKVLTEESVETG